MRTGSKSDKVLTIRVPEATRARLSAYAAKQGKTSTQVLIEYIESLPDVAAPEPPASAKQTSARAKSSKPASAK
jgi:hypothetical protein